MNAFIIALLAFLAFTGTVAAESDSPTGAPAAPAPAAAPDLFPVVEELAEESVVLADGSGVVQPLASHTALQILEDADPWYYCSGAACVGGKRTWAGPGGLVAAVANFDVDNGSGMIYIETGPVYAAGFTIDGLARPGMNALTGLVWDGVGPGVPTIGGLFTVWNKSGGFTIRGLNVQGLITIHNSSGPLTLSNLTVLVAGGNGIDVHDYNGGVVMEKVFSHNFGWGAFVNNSSGTGSVTIRDSAFTNSTTAYGLTVVSKGSITITNTTVSHNNTQGAQIVNSTGTGNVTIRNSTFNNTFTGAGLSIISSGTVLLNGVTASGNATNGASVVNSGAAVPRTITIQSSNFNANKTSGLALVSKGAIILNHVSASNNESGLPLHDGVGASIVNAAGTNAGVTILNSLGDNFFNFNGDTVGINIVSNGAIILNGVHALKNLGAGAALVNSGSTLNVPVVINTSEFSDNANFGLSIVSRGAVTLNRVNASGNTGAGSFGASITNTPGTAGVVVSGSTFDRNGGPVGLSIVSLGAVTIRAVSASFNTAGIGMSISNAGSALAPITILGGITPSLFTLNGVGGVSAVSSGAVTVNNIQVMGNTGFGMNIVNPAGKRNVAVTASEFSVNQQGLVVVSLGSITLTRVAASYNTVHGGVVLNNSGDPTVLKPVTVTRSYFNKNIATGGGDPGGLTVSSRGLILLNSIEAVDNSGINGFGLNLSNAAGGTAGITIVGSYFDNRITANSQLGISAASNGAITISRTIVLGNANLGINLANIGGIGNISLTSSTITGNLGGGLNVVTAGAVTLTNVVMQFNLGMGGANIVCAPPPPLEKPVIIRNSVFNGNANFGLNLIARGAVTLSNVNASHNTVSGGMIIINTSPTAGVTITGVPGTVLYNGNGGNGITINAQGKVVLSGLIADGNAIHGIQVHNAGATSADVVVTNVTANAQTAGAGIHITSSGSIILTNITATNNPGSGLILTNMPAASTAKGITLNRVRLYGNGVQGALISAKGTATLNNVISNNNATGVIILASSKAQVLSTLGGNHFNNNSASGLVITSTGTVTLSKVTANDNGYAGGGSSGLVITGTTTTITCGLFNGNGRSGIQATLGANTLTLKGVTAIGNGVIAPAGDVISTGPIMVIPMSCGSW